MTKGARQQRYIETESRSILSISPNQDDHSTLQRILDTDTEAGSPVNTGWVLTKTANLSSAMRILRQSICPAVICERDLPQGNWKDLLKRTRLLQDPPLIIVASLHADDYLWAEALNLGAYDVVSKPFDRSEVIRVMSSACLRWHRDRGRPATSAILQRATAAV